MSRRRLPQPHDVWRNRHACRCCFSNSNRSGSRNVYHRVLVLAVNDDATVVVRDMTIWGADRLTGDPYVLPPDRFGSLEAGGLGLIGALVDGKVRPARHPDTRSRPVSRVDAAPSPREYSIYGARRAA